MNDRVLFVSSHARPGGSERYLTRLVHGLDDRVAKVVALEDGWLVDELEPRPAVIPTTAHWRSLVGAARVLRRELEVARPALVHANGIKAAVVAALATVRTGIPFVWVKHDFSHGGLLSNVVAARSARIVGVSAAVASALPRRYAAKVTVVHPAVDVEPADRDEARRAVAALAGRPEGSEFVALVGRLDPYKGHGELIEILGALRAEHPKLHAVFVGGDDPSHPLEPERLRGLASRAGVADAISWLGHQPDACRLVAGCSLLVVPTSAASDGLGTEGFGLAPLEAFAVGTPVAGYAAGALPEVLGDCAVLVPPGDREALRAAIDDLLRDGRRRTTLAACGQDLVSNRYTVAAMLEGMSRVYDEVAREARHGRD
ncbi:MAG: glycosyltransferase family 4 protein [Gaiellaceae bacterium]